jgi:hypothetical protein
MPILKNVVQMIHSKTADSIYFHVQLFVLLSNMEIVLDSELATNIL